MVERGDPNGGSIIDGEHFSVEQDTMPKAASWNEQPSGEIAFHFLPNGLNFQRHEAFLKYGEA